MRTIKNNKIIAVVSIAVIVFVIGTVFFTSSIIGKTDEAITKSIPDVFKKINNDIYMLDGKEFGTRTYIDIEHYWNEEESIVYVYPNDTLVKQNLLTKEIEWRYKAKDGYSFYKTRIFSKGNHLYFIQEKSEYKGIITCLDSNGVELWSKDINKSKEKKINIYDFEYHLMDDGFLVGSDIFKSKKENFALKKYDYEGNVIWEKTYNFKCYPMGAILHTNKENVFLEMQDVEELADDEMKFIKLDNEGNVLSEKTIKISDSFDIFTIIDDKIKIVADDFGNEEETIMHIFQYDLDFNLISSNVIRDENSDYYLFEVFENYFYLEDCGLDYKEGEPDLRIDKYDYNGNFLEEICIEEAKDYSFNYDVDDRITNRLGKIFLSNYRSSDMKSGEFVGIENDVMKFSCNGEVISLEFLADQITEVVDAKTKDLISLADIEKGDMVYLETTKLDLSKTRTIEKFRLLRVFVYKKEFAKSILEKKLLGQKELKGNIARKSIDKKGNGYVYLSMDIVNSKDKNRNIYKTSDDFPYSIKVNVTSNTQINLANKNDTIVDVELDSPITDIEKINITASSIVSDIVYAPICGI